MKALIVTIMTIVTTNVFAAEIQSGYYHRDTDSIVLNVTYQGGCEEHTFKVEVNQCNRAMPAKCIARLIDETKGDFCRAIIQTQVTIPAQQVVDDISINKLQIQGANDSSALITFF